MHLFHLLWPLAGKPASSRAVAKAFLQASEEVQDRLLSRGAERLEALSHSIGFRHAGDAKAIECISRGAEGALGVVSQNRGQQSTVCRSSAAVVEEKDRCPTPHSGALWRFRVSRQGLRHLWRRSRLPPSAASDKRSYVSCRHHAPESLRATASCRTCLQAKVDQLSKPCGHPPAGRPNLGRACHIHS